MTPVSHLDDPDMQAVPAALMRAAENARRLAEQTGTPWVVRTAPPAETVPAKGMADAHGERRVTA